MWFVTCCREVWPLTPLPEEEGHPFLQLAQWAPRGHGIVMVYNYDVYYRPGPRSSNGYRVTNTAVPGVVSNGVPDWLYEGKRTLNVRMLVEFMIS